MKFKELKNGFKLPYIGFGTWKIGGLLEKDTSLDKQSLYALNTALESGYVHIDTAQMYANGHAETLVGEVIKNYDRSSLFITTKIAKTKLSYEDVKSSFEESLKRLQTSYVDLLLIHAYNASIPMSETMKAFDELVDEGKVKYLGVSNFQVEQLEEAQSHSKHKLVVNQIEYNLKVRNESTCGGNINMESQMLNYCKENDILVVAHRPLAKGELVHEEKLNVVAKKYGKSKAQIALAWLLSKDNVVAIPMSSNKEHIIENLESSEIILDKEDIFFLDNYENK